MAGLDLNTVANLSTALALVAALLFGAIQVRHSNRRRKEELLGEIMEVARSEHVSRAIQTVMDLPESMTEARLAKLGPEAAQAVNVIENVFDAIGWNVHRRLVSLHDLDSWWGGQIRGLWRKLQPLAEERRAQKQTNNDIEWTQWLVEQMDRFPAVGKKAGAHVSYRDWHP